jgi:hypothetical protein
MVFSSTMEVSLEQGRNQEYPIYFLNISEGWDRVSPGGEEV